MTKRNDRMVLRTVYLPVSLDEQLKKLAYEDDTSKGELIRESVKAMVRSRVKAMGPSPLSK